MNHDRDDLINALRTRIIAVNDTGDPAAVVSAEALAEASSLYTTLPSERIDVEALYILGIMYLHRHRFTSDASDLAEAGRFLHPVADLTGQVPRDLIDLLPSPPEVTDLPFQDAVALRSYGNALMQVVEPDRATAVLRQALAALPSAHPDRDRYITDLGCAVEMTYDRTHWISDLEEAIRLFREALSLVPEGHEDRGMCLSNLANVLRRRVEHLVPGKGLDTATILAEAVWLGRQAVLETPDHDPDKRNFRTNAGAVLMASYQSTGDTTALAEAVSHLRTAVSSGHQGHSPSPATASNLAVALLLRVRRIPEPCPTDSAQPNATAPPTPPARYAKASRTCSQSAISGSTGPWPER